MNELAFFEQSDPARRSTDETMVSKHHQLSMDLILWLCHKSGKPLKPKGNLRRFWVRLETKNLFDFNHLTINLTMFMT
jgi:hypothetical protein